MVSIVLESVLALLLVVAMAMGRHYAKRMMALPAQRRELAAMLEEFRSATEKAESAAREAIAASEASTKRLAKTILEAREAYRDLDYMHDRAQAIIGKLEKVPFVPPTPIVDAGRPTSPVRQVRAGLAADARQERTAAGAQQKTQRN